KDLENIIESQRSENVKEGVGYNDVPHSAADLKYIERFKNEVETLKEEKDVVDGKFAPLLKSSKDLENIIEKGQNKHSTTAENGESTDNILSKPTVKFVMAGDRPAERPTTNKA
nr:hypothetical protein [Tanacetum cinerariifolium]